MTLKVDIHSFPAKFSIKGIDSVENKPASSLVSLGNALIGIPLPKSG